VVRVRWFWWVLALVPAFAGFVSLEVFGVGDFRSSGLIAGMSLSLGLVAVLVLWRRPWRGKRGVSRWLSTFPGLLLGLVALVGLSAGLPEFLQSRGLFLDVDGVGPRALAGFDGGYLVVGDDGDSGIVWFSEDGTSWSQVDDPIFDGLVFRDLIVVEDRLVAVSRSSDPTEAVVLSSTDGLAWEVVGRFGNADHGTSPDAISRTGSGLVVISDIIGNDVEFYSSADMSSWTVSEPVGVFDDGEGGSDIACDEELCVGVGSHDATYRSELETDTGVAWISTTGENFDLVDHDFQTDRLTAIAWTTSGFVAVGNNSSGQGVAWQSQHGQQWTPVSGPFNEMTIDGVAEADDKYIIFGRNPATSQLVIWTSTHGAQWDQEVVSDGFPEGSLIRTISDRNGVRVAAGIASDTLSTIIWTSTNNQPWQHTTTLDSP